MNKEQANEVLMKLWLQKADDALESAKLELAGGHLSFAVNRLYYSCFYAVRLFYSKTANSLPGILRSCRNLTKIMSRPAGSMPSGAGFIRSFSMTGRREIISQPLLLNILKLQSGLHRRRFS